MKNLNLILVLLLPLYLCLESCGQKDSSSDLKGRTPLRPKIVPKQAVWAGGDKGGVWIHCVLSDKYDSCYICKVYADVSGVLWHEKDRWSNGRYCLQSGKSIDPDSLSNMYSGYDGSRIFLNGGRILLLDVSRFYDSLALIDSGMTRDRVEALMGIGSIENTDSGLYIWYFNTPPIINDSPKCYIDKKDHKVVKVIR